MRLQPFTAPLWHSPASCSRHGCRAVLSVEADPHRRPVRAEARPTPWRGSYANEMQRLLGSRLSSTTSRAQTHDRPEAVARAARRLHAPVARTGTNAANASLFKKMPYDQEKIRAGGVPGAVR